MQTVTFIPRRSGRQSPPPKFLTELIGGGKLSDLRILQLWLLGDRTDDFNRHSIFRIIRLPPLSRPCGFLLMIRLSCEVNFSRWKLGMGWGSLPPNNGLEYLRQMFAPPPACSCVVSVPRSSRCRLMTCEVRPGQHGNSHSIIYYCVAYNGIMCLLSADHLESRLVYST